MGIKAKRTSYGIVVTDKLTGRITTIGTTDARELSPGGDLNTGLKRATAAINRESKKQERHHRVPTTESVLSAINPPVEDDASHAESPRRPSAGERQE